MTAEARRRRIARQRIRLIKIQWLVILVLVIALVVSLITRPSAGYVAPQGLRNILIISATPYQWKHMISQRICRRNTDETRYVMLKIWEELYELAPALFAPETTGPFCMTGKCKEGKMSCGKPLDAGMTPSEIIAADFPLLAGGADNA